MKTIFIIYGCWIIGTFAGSIADFNNLAVIPKEIYEINNLNMFGCWIVFLISFIFNPMFYIAHFIYWLFHVGRKE